MVLVAVTELTGRESDPQLPVNDNNFILRSIVGNVVNYTVNVARGLAALYGGRGVKRQRGGIPWQPSRQAGWLVAML